MQTTVFGRLYEKVADLLPSIATAPVGTTFYATPQRKNDLAVCCHVVAVEGDMRVIELAQDSICGTDPVPSPAMTLRVDTAQHLAELMVVQDKERFEVVYAGGHTFNPRRTQLNLYSLNWMRALRNMGAVFHAVEPAVIA